MSGLQAANKYSIKDLERLSNIKAHTIRIWEQRYGMLTPKRTETNIRFYSDDELRKLLNISLLNRNGYKVSRIAAMQVDEIEQEVQSITASKSDLDTVIDSLVFAMLEMKETAFNNILEEAISKMGLEEVFLQIVFPFLEKVGNLWVTGSVRPIQERFASNLVRQKLITYIDALPSEYNQSSKKFLLFTPENESHEMSLLFNCYQLKSRKHIVQYLGVNIPLYDLVSFCSSQHPDFLVSCFTIYPTGEALKNYLEVVSEHFKQSTIILSGYQIRSYKGIFPSNVIRFQGVIDFIKFLDNTLK